MTDTSANDVASASGLDSSPPVAMAAHCWSGWPGAWCLDCGADDRNELAIAEGAFGADEDGNPGRIHAGYGNGPCPEPGSRRHDPYAAIPDRPAPA